MGRKRKWKIEEAVEETKEEEMDGDDQREEARSGGVDGLPRERERGAKIRGKKGVDKDGHRERGGGGRSGRE